MYIKKKKVSKTKKSVKLSFFLFCLSLLSVVGCFSGFTLFQSLNACSSLTVVARGENGRVIGDVFRQNGTHYFFPGLE